MKITAAYMCLFEYKHFFIVNVNTKNLEKSLLYDDFEITGYRCGLQQYNQNYIIKSMANSFDNDDLLLQRAELEAMAELTLTTKD